MGKSTLDGTICSSIRALLSPHLVVFRTQYFITDTEGHYPKSGGFTNCVCASGTTSQLALSAVVSRRYRSRVTAVRGSICHNSRELRLYALARSLWASCQGGEMMDIL